MRERRSRTNWGKENWDVFHCLEDAGAFEIARGAFRNEFEHGEWRFCAGHIQIIEKNWAKQRFFPGELCLEQLGDDRAEEKPPEVEGAVEAVKFERFDAEAGLFEKFCGAMDGVERLRSCGADGGGVKKADADF